MTLTRVDHGGLTVAVCALAFCLRMAWALAMHVPPTWDGVLYERGAQSIARSLGYSCFMFGPAADASVATAYYPVGYPAFLAAFYIVFGMSPIVVAVSGALTGAATVALVHRLALRIATPFAAGSAAIVYALMPGQVIFATTPMTETLWGFLLTLAVWLLARCPSGIDRRSFALAGFTFAAATYVRPQAALLVPVLFALPTGTWQMRLGRAIGATALVLAMVAPWSLRNCTSIDGCAFVSTNGGSNLAIGSVPRATGTYFQLGADDGCRGVVGEVARDRCWRRIAWMNISHDPARWLRLGATKIYHCLEYETYPASYLRHALPTRISASTERHLSDALTFTWKALALTAIVALAQVWRWRSLGVTGALCVATFAGVIATHAGFFGGDRYHLPVTSFVAVIAAAVAPRSSSRNAVKRPG